MDDALTNDPRFAATTIVVIDFEGLTPAGQPAEPIEVPALALHPLDGGLVELQRRQVPPWHGPFNKATFLGGRVAFVDARFSGVTVTFHDAAFFPVTVDFARATFSGGAASSSARREPPQRACWPQQGLPCPLVSTLLRAGDRRAATVAAVVLFTRPSDAAVERPSLRPVQFPCR
ncbi:hypothetical protein F750_7137 (plasmid) [Streptomyces sp. PAMC 26508]|uniref:hypothetical protein n=1 Tax=Streptomyces sp. PAMC 26508 TaxID=1265601 RepID=UPI0002C6D86B|nr:hypothetical protein [Streptomyces sp. PAMC 26508]AGJ59561.1 hypothetical protein F750_7137 [Streptomyces sp. PAMC 26508]